MSVATGDAIIFMTVMGVMSGLFIACMRLLFKSEKPALKVLGLLGGYQLLCFGAYMITAIAYDMTETAFIETFFYWIFVILQIGFLPLFFICILWYLYYLYQASKLNEMVEHGLPLDKAYQRTTGKGMRKVRKEGRYNSSW